MAKDSLSRRAQAFESHWSLGKLIAEHWIWLAPLFGLSGLSGFAAWARQTALSAPWYEKVLVVLFAVLGAAFLIFGCRSFFLWAQRSRREASAIAAGIAWSGHAYSKGAVISGGSHRIAEIFGTDQLRANLTFRNCQIIGPGIALLIACHVEKSEFFGLPRVQFIEPDGAVEVGSCAHQFIKCRFENCTFNGILFISNILPSGGDVVSYRLVPSP